MSHHNTLFWENKRKYNHEDILWIKKIISIRLKKYNGMLWVENKEIDEVLKYIRKKGIRLNTGKRIEADETMERMIIRSIYNQIKTQKEIRLMWNPEMTEEQLDRNLTDLMSKVDLILSNETIFRELSQDLKSNETIEFLKSRLTHKKNISQDDLPVIIYIEKWIREQNLPIQYLLSYVKKHFYKFKTLTKYFAYIKYLVIEKEKELRAVATEFEKKVEQILETTIGDNFITEDEIKYTEMFNITPDVLLLEPIVVELNGKSFNIHWIDAKNFFHAGIPFMTEKLKSQAAKYNKEFGMGAFLFSFGFDNSDIIPGVLMLSL